MVGTLANVPIPTIADMLREQQRDFLRKAESYQKDITRVKQKIQKLTEFDARTKGLFQSSLDDFELAMQVVMVLNGMSVSNDGSYILPTGIDKTWFTQKKSDNELIDKLKNGMGVSIPLEVEKLIADHETELAQNPELLKTILEAWRKLNGQVNESALLTGLVSVAQEMIDTKITDKIVDTFSDSLFMYLRNNTTAFLDRGLVALTNTGANLVVRETSNAFKQLVRFGATKGLPIIGGLFDFGLMKAQGEDTGDAVVKATAHTVIGVGTGVVVGALVSASVPAILVGGSVFVAGVVGSMAFDYLWDNKEKIIKNVSKTVNNVKKEGEKMVNKENFLFMLYLIEIIK